MKPYYSDALVTIMISEGERVFAYWLIVCIALELVAIALVSRHDSRHPPPRLWE